MSTKDLKAAVKPNAAPPQTQPNTQIAARVEHLKSALMGVKRQVESLLADKSKSDKFMAAALVVAQDKTLVNCRVESIVQALVGVAMSDLNVDKNIGHVYLVKYGDDVQMQIGYRGYIQLLFRAGWLIKAYPIYNCDDFSMAFNGWDNLIELIQNIDEREEEDRDWVYQNLRGVYVVARHSVTHDEYSDFVPRKIIEKLRKNSPAQQINKWTKEEDKPRIKSGLPVGIWHDWYGEMARAKAVKILSKRLPIGDSRVSLAIAADEKSEAGMRVDYMKTAESNTIVADIKPSKNYVEDSIDSVATETPNEKPDDKKTEESAGGSTDWEDLLNNAQSQEEVLSIFASIPENIQKNFEEQRDLVLDSFR